jgi:monoterpene epsilon-lactone hydrolase
LSADDYNAYRMASDLGIVVYSVDYSLSPSAKFPVALHQTVKAYDAVAKKYGEVLAVGSSVGANVLITTILRALAKNADPPKAAGFFSPAVDLRLIGDSYVANDGRDPIATTDTLSKLYAAYLNTASAANSQASPIRADYSAGFVPTIITTGTRDLLQSDSARLYWKLRDVCAPVHLRVQEGMWHNCESVPYLPEGERNMTEVFGFLKEHI